MVAESAGAAGRVRIEKLRVASDARGALFEPLAPPELAGWRNVHAVLTHPGAVRGNHRHLRGTEITAVYGAALVRYRDDTGITDVLVPAGEAWRFEFPAGVSHAFRAAGEESFLLVSFNTELHDPARPDVERDELITP